MTTPPAQAFSVLVAVAATAITLWHMAHYDGLRCLRPTARDWFRALMCWCLVLACLCFTAANVAEAVVAYNEYYTMVEYETLVTPWQLWSAHNQAVARSAYYALATGWVLLQSIHLEEFLYWAYLISSIRTAGGARSWTRSGYFRLWAAGTLGCAALLYASIRIEYTNLDMLRVYLFLTGSTVSTLFALMSIWLGFAVPRFIRDVAAQGAPADVVDRLQFFSELHLYRTWFRVGYALSFLILAADGMTSAKRVNRSDFWSDFLFLLGMWGIFSSSALSVVILLPRNMSVESHPATSAGAPAVAAFAPYRKPAGARQGMDDDELLAQYAELGDRLNVAPDAMAAEAWEMSRLGALPAARAGGGRAPFAPYAQAAQGGWGADGGRGTEAERPFARTADRRARASELPSALPAAVARFRGPLETAPAGQAGAGARTTPRVFVTSETVVEEAEA